MPINPKKNLVVTKPNCFVVGVQELNHFGIREFLDSEGFPEFRYGVGTPGELLAEIGGRVCYMSFNKGRPHDEYIRNIKEQRHGSVLEHAVVTFILTGVSRSFTHECVRHRSGWSYSQLSQRFVDERPAQYVAPWAIRRVPELLAAFRRFVIANREAYELLQGQVRVHYNHDQDETSRLGTELKKLVNGAARSILANAAETKIQCTVNARAFRHFLEARCSQSADHEIREVAYLLYTKMLPIWPDILGDYVVERDEDGVEYLSTAYTKV